MSTIVRVEESSSAAATPRRLARSESGSDRVFAIGGRAVGATVLAITGGIGLFLARTALRLQQGDVRLANRPGGGLVATVYLPVAP